jgi:hypothetical protein
MGRYSMSEGTHYYYLSRYHWSTYTCPNTTTAATRTNYQRDLWSWSYIVIDHRVQSFIHSPLLSYGLFPQIHRSINININLPVWFPFLLSPFPSLFVVHSTHLPISGSGSSDYIYCTVFIIHLLLGTKHIYHEPLPPQKT